jgi:hypothetical protein
LLVSGFGLLHLYDVVFLSIGCVRPSPHIRGVLLHGTRVSNYAFLR